MPNKCTVLLWVVEDRAGFSDQYTKACEARAHHWADELLDISDDASNDWMERQDKEGGSLGWQVNGDAVARSRLRVDTRKWLLSKMLPKFADKAQVEHSGQIGFTQPIAQVPEKEGGGDYAWQSQDDTQGSA